MIKLTPADKWFNLCVKLRCNWTCEYCGVNFEHQKEIFDCSHYQERGKLTTRYHPQNAFGHCRDCHYELGGHHWNDTNDGLFDDHYVQVFGETNQKIIKHLSRQIYQGHKKDLKHIADHYRLESKKLEKCRKAGDDQRIDFDIFPSLQGLTNAIKDELHEPIADRCE